MQKNAVTHVALGGWGKVGRGSRGLVVISRVEKYIGEVTDLSSTSSTCFGGTRHAYYSSGGFGENRYPLPTALSVAMTC